MQTEPPNSARLPHAMAMGSVWPTVIASRRRAPVLTLSLMSGLWWKCAEKTCFGRPSGSILF